jgi:hypothetical protein
VIINVVQSSKKIGSNSSDKIIATKVIGIQGIAGRAGRDAEFPDNGEVGSLLAKTESGVEWTKNPDTQILNGGNF